MKVNYRSILKELDDIIFGAKKAHRTIESIELTPGEFSEFRRELARAYNIIPTSRSKGLYLGVKLEEQNELRKDRP